MSCLIPPFFLPKLGACFGMWAFTVGETFVVFSLALFPLAFDSRDGLECVFFVNIYPKSVPFPFPEHGFGTRHVEWVVAGRFGWEQPDR